MVHGAIWKNVLQQSKIGLNLLAVTLLLFLSPRLEVDHRNEVAFNQQPIHPVERSPGRRKFLFPQHRPLRSSPEQVHRFRPFQKGKQ